MSAVIGQLVPKLNPPSLTFGQETLISYASTPSCRFQKLEHSAVLVYRSGGDIHDDGRVDRPQERESSRG